MMNFRWTVGTLGLTLALMGNAAHAENPDHMRQLLTTGNCPGCDLSETSLNGLALQEADLQGANLSGSHLQDIDLTRANLSSANLQGAHFTSANFTGANLQNADLANATSTSQCSASDYGFAEDVESCFLQVMIFQTIEKLCQQEPELITMQEGAADFCNEEELANIATYSAYYYASMQRFTTPLRMRGADLSGASLQNAVFLGADFSYATFANTETAGANLNYVQLFNTDTTEINNADLTKAWDSLKAVGEWMIALEEEKKARTRREIGRVSIGSMSRAQQAYYLENSRFSTELSLLGLGISEESEQYRLGIVEPDSSRRIVQYALNTTGELTSFLSVVSVEVDAESNDEFTTSAICESETTGAITATDLPEIEAPDDFFNCPAGWKLVN